MQVYHTYNMSIGLVTIFGNLNEIMIWNLFQTASYDYRCQLVSGRGYHPTTSIVF